MAALTNAYRPTVFLVDDNVYIRKLLCKILEGKYKIYTVASWFEALALLHQTVNQDLIITDTMMPGMDGYELIKIIRRNGLFKHIPICILSDNQANIIKDELGHMQEEEIFSKPFDPAVLIHRLDTLLNKLQEQSYK